VCFRLQKDGARLPHKTNLLLDALPDRERQALGSHLTRVEFKQQDVLFDIRDTVGEVYFPIDAVISLVVPLSTGEVVETAMVGRDGIVGSSAALNGRVSLNRAIVEIGGSCLRCSVEALKEIVKNHSKVQSLVGGHEQALADAAVCSV
jgi:CRP-like cAMP-binding protein